MQAGHQEKDLATRAFNNFYFQISWLLFLTVAVKLVWPLRNVLLVFWVYGTDAYYNQGIRVIKNKPTLFSNGKPCPDLPDFVTGMAVFLITVLGLSLLMCWLLRLYGKILRQRDIRY
jgi:hypothetical protein